MKYKFPAKPVKCRLKCSSQNLCRKNKLVQHESLQIARNIRYGLDIFSSCFEKSTKGEDTPFAGFSAQEAQIAAQSLKKEVDQLNATNGNETDSNPFRCKNSDSSTFKASGIIFAPCKVVLSKIGDSNVCKSGNGILRKARLNVQSDYKVQDGSFSTTESWLQATVEEDPPASEENAKREEQISSALLLKSHKNIVSKKVWNKDNACSSNSWNGNSSIKGSQPKVQTKGPRIKHVCRSASVVLGLPVATFVDHHERKLLVQKEKDSSIVPNEETSESCESLQSSSKHDLFDAASDISSICSHPEDQGDREQNQAGKIGARKLQDFYRDESQDNKLISVDYWRNYDPDEVCDSGFALIGSEPSFPLAICFLCGSAGLDQFQLIHCLVCCEPYHEYCLNSILTLNEHLTEAWKMDWICPQCVVCAVCGEYGSNQLQISCRKCLKFYHVDCISSDLPHQMMNCIKCKRWIHKGCNENLCQEQKQNLVLFTKFSKAFVCHYCYTDESLIGSNELDEVTNNTKSDYLNILISLKTNKKLFELLKWSPSNAHKRKRRKAKSLNGLDTDLSSEDYRDDYVDIVHEMSRTRKRRGVSLDSPTHINEFEFKENNSLSNNLFYQKRDVQMNIFGSNAKSNKNLVSIKEKVDNNEYSSFVDLHYDILDVLYNIDYVDLIDLYSDIVQEIFSWLDNNIQSKSDLLMWEDVFNETNFFYDAIKQRQQLKTSQNLSNPALAKKKSSSDKMNRMIYVEVGKRDLRICVLCRKQGEGIENLEGRLLYCGHNEWVHCNCALWSSEVFEEVDGSLQNIHNAIKRSKFIQCNYCTKRGATVGCCSKNCLNTYHLLCAKKSQCLFLDSKMIYCNLHPEEVEKNRCNVEKNLFINRPIYVEQNYKRKQLPAEHIKLMIGAFKIHSFGKFLSSMCDLEDIAVPINFHCSRLFWSTKEPSKMVEYDIKTKMESVVVETIESGVNETVSHAVQVTACESSNELIKEVVGNIIDLVCLREETEDNQLLTPEVKDAIFKDLHHEFIDGLFMNDFLLRYDDILNEPVEDNAAILHVKIQEDSRREKDWTKKFLNPSLEILQQIDGNFEESDSDEDEEEGEDCDEPVKCFRCHRTYRTTTSYNNHLSTCTVVEYLLSSESENEEEPENSSPCYELNSDLEPRQTELPDVYIAKENINDNIMEMPIQTEMSNIITPKLQQWAPQSSYIAPQNYASNYKTSDNNFLEVFDTPSPVIIGSQPTFVMDGGMTNPYFNVNGKGRPFTIQQNNSAVPTLVIQQPPCPQLISSYIPAPQQQYITIAPSTYAIQPTVVMQPNIMPLYITNQPAYTPQTYLLVNSTAPAPSVPQPQIIINNDPKVLSKQVTTYEKTQTKHYYKQMSYNDNEVGCVKVIKSTTQKTTIKTEEETTPLSFPETPTMKPVESSSHSVSEKAGTFAKEPTVGCLNNTFVPTKTPNSSFPEYSTSRPGYNSNNVSDNILNSLSNLHERNSQSPVNKVKSLQKSNFQSILPKIKESSLPNYSKLSSNPSTVNFSTQRNVDNPLETRICDNSSLNINNKAVPPPLSVVSNQSQPTLTYSCDTNNPAYKFNLLKEPIVVKEKSSPNTNNLTSNLKPLYIGNQNLKQEVENKKKSFNPSCFRTYPPSKRIKRNESGESKPLSKLSELKSFRLNKYKNCLSNNTNHSNVSSQPKPNRDDEPTLAQDFKPLYPPNVPLELSSLHFSPNSDSEKLFDFEPSKEYIPSPVFSGNDRQTHCPDQIQQNQVKVDHSDVQQNHFDWNSKNLGQFDTNVTKANLACDNKIEDDINELVKPNETNIKERHFSCASYLEEFEKQIKEDLERDEQEMSQVSKTDKVLLSPKIQDVKEPQPISTPRTPICLPPIKSPTLKVLPPIKSDSKIDSIEKKHESKDFIEEKENITWNSQSQNQTPENNSVCTMTTQRIVYEIKSPDGFVYRTSCLEDAWQKVFEAVQAARLSKFLPLLPANSFKKLKSLGMDNKTVKYVLDQLPGSSGQSGSYSDETTETLPGAARTRSFQNSERNPLETFSWLASDHRRTPKLPKPIRLANDNKGEKPETSQRSSSRIVNFQNLGEVAQRDLYVHRSDIHGVGLFCVRDYKPKEMVIEYTGEIIRAPLTDKREREYNSKGIGCYMFKIDDQTYIDATKCGNAARFINHSCDPNCHSKVVENNGKQHIIIYTLRHIPQGEELTYDYRFPIEEEEKKIRCRCQASRCRGFLN